MKPLKNGKVTVGSFDLIKGVAIILVILFHTIPRYPSSAEPYSSVLNIPKEVVDFILGWYTNYGLMPLFLFVSGYFFKPTNIKNMLKKTASSLLIPYAMVTVAYAVVCPILFNIVFESWQTSLLHGFKYVVAFLLGFGAYGKVIFGIETLWNTAAWFLLASFVAQNLLNLICKINRESFQCAVVAVCVLLGCYLHSITFGFFCIPQGLLCVGYIYFGYQLKKKKWLLNLMNQIWIYCILSAFWLAQIKWGKFDIFSGQYHYFLFDYIAAGATGLLFMMVGLRLGEIEWKVFDILKQAGMYSYWILPIHAAEMEAVPWWYWIALPLQDKPTLGLIIELMCKAIIIVTVCWIIKAIQKYNYTKKMSR